MDAVCASEVAELRGDGAAQARVVQGHRAHIRIIRVSAVEVGAAPHARVVHTLRVGAVALEGDRAHACGTVRGPLCARVHHACDQEFMCEYVFAWP